MKIWDSVYVCKILIELFLFKGLANNFSGSSYARLLPPLKGVPNFGPIVWYCKLGCCCIDVDWARLYSSLFSLLTVGNTVRGCGKAFVSTGVEIEAGRPPDEFSAIKLKLPIGVRGLKGPGPGCCIGVTLYSSWTVDFIASHLGFDGGFQDIKSSVIEWPVKKVKNVKME